MDMAKAAADMVVVREASDLSSDGLCNLMSRLYGQNTIIANFVRNFAI